MPKIKQVATKRPRNQSSSVFPVAVKRAIKSVMRVSDEPIVTSSRSPILPRIPQKVAQIVHSVRSNNTTDLSAFSEPQPKVPGVLKKIQKEIISTNTSTSRSRFQLYSIPRRPFQKLVRDISYQFIPDCRYTPEALEALQTAAEDFMVSFFEDAATCMMHAKRKTLMAKDLELVAKLRRIEYEPL
jgi:Histones H3 and H4